MTVKLAGWQPGAEYRLISAWTSWRTRSGTAFSAFPSVPALLPVDVPVEATVSLATATLSSGGQGFGRASTFFPGTLVAGLRPLLETGAGVEVPVPDYPIVV